MCRSRARSLRASGWWNVSTSTTGTNSSTVPRHATALTAGFVGLARWTEDLDLDGVPLRFRGTERLRAAAARQQSLDAVAQCCAQMDVATRRLREQRAAFSAMATASETTVAEIARWQDVPWTTARSRLRLWSDGRSHGPVSAERLRHELDRTMALQRRLEALRASYPALCDAAADDGWSSGEITAATGMSVERRLVHQSDWRRPFSIRPPGPFSWFAVRRRPRACAPGTHMSVRAS